MILVVNRQNVRLWQCERKITDRKIHCLKKHQNIWRNKESSLDRTHNSEIENDEKTEVLLKIDE